MIVTAYRITSFNYCVSHFIFLLLWYMSIETVERHYRSVREPECQHVSSFFYFLYCMASDSHLIMFYV